MHCVPSTSSTFPRSKSLGSQKHPTAALCNDHKNLTMDVRYIVYPKKYAHGFCFAVPCCGYTLTYFPISTRLTSLALWQSNDCPSASKATLMNKDKYFMWNQYEQLHNHSKAKHNKTVCTFLGIYCSWDKADFMRDGWVIGVVAHLTGVNNPWKRQQDMDACSLCKNWFKRIQNFI